MTTKNTYDYGKTQAIKSNQTNFSDNFTGKEFISSVRDAYSFYLKKIIQKNKKYVLIDADLGTVAKTLHLRKKLKNRYIQTGISEQNGIGVAAGIAQFGKIPIFQSLSVFLTGRAFDQIRESICYSDLNVKLIGLHGGMTLSPDGATHQTGEDIALMSSLPNMEVFVPADATQIKYLLPKFLKSKKPGYLRLFFPEAKNITKKNKNLYKVQIIKPLKKINIISYGYILNKSYEAVEELKNKNIHCGLINCHTIKPLDKKNILKIAKKSKILFIVEDHNSFGGLGSIISQYLSSANPLKIISINTNDKFGKTGLPEENLNYLKLSTKKIVKTILKYYYEKK